MNAQSLYVFVYKALLVIFFWTITCLKTPQMLQQSLFIDLLVSLVLYSVFGLLLFFLKEV